MQTRRSRLYGKVAQPRQQERRISLQVRGAAIRYDYLSPDQQVALRHAQRVLFVLDELGLSKRDGSVSEATREEVALQVISFATDEARADELIRDKFLRRILGLC